MDFRFATRSDIAPIAALLADDEIALSREANGSLEAYLAAWDQMEAEPFNRAIVATDGDDILAVVQVTIISGLARSGMKRGQLEGVRVKSTARGSGIGQQLIRYAVEVCRAQGCGLVQLTTDKRRADARRFYESLGFEATHEGMKIVF